MASNIKNLGIVIVAGGGSSRYGRKNKLLERLNELPVFVHSIRNFLDVVTEKQIILVVPEKEKEHFVKELEHYLPHCKIMIVNGGKTRLKSVHNGLNAISEDIKFVAVHDAARPLASADILVECVKSAKKFGSAVPAKRFIDTVKRTLHKNKVVETLDRENLWIVETPQIFQREALISAYEKALGNKKKDFTDDAGIMEAAGEDVYLVENLDCNIKITYPSDLILAEFWLTKKTVKRLNKKIEFFMEKSIVSEK